MVNFSFTFGTVEKNTSLKTNEKSLTNCDKSVTTMET